ncbi:hypothetical protein C7448_103333 [Tenacibaculum gallaicum]|uniref:Uncharacterized protein n=1 Tax=Tenacibaculum gallaicum TaxID=561505 RepID=A0A3E0I1H8_9FLAO|nr:hypothetical protein [Tenacibaculum gallaicum]REH52598.1 hypothetical protein C7448_103333 [Tenacibaculum gallaicum]
MNNNINSPELIIYPPGELILKVQEKNILATGHITFENNFKQPLPSLVEAKFNATKTAINVKVLFFVDSQEKLSSVNVHQLFSISNFGNCKLQLFLSCSQEQAKILRDYPSPNEYRAYTVNFTTNSTSDFPSHISLSDIKVIQAFIWNIDPKTSRGTETTVQTTD